MKKFLNIILLIIGLFLFYELISRVGLAGIAQALKSANLLFCAAGVFFYLIAVALRARKWLFWGKILKRELKYREILPFFLANSLMGNLTPLKSGEAVTPFLFKKYFNVSVGRGFSLIILDRFSELAVFVCLLIGAACYLLWRGVSSHLVFTLFVIIFLTLFLIAFLLLGIVLFRGATLKFIHRMAGVRLLKKTSDFLEKEVLNLYEGIELVRRERIYSRVILFTALGWFFEFGASYSFLSSVSSLSLLDSISAQVFAYVATLVAFVPGGIGVSEISWVSLLNLMGYAKVQTAAGVILARIFLTGTIILGGAVGFYFLKKRKKTISP